MSFIADVFQGAAKAVGSIVSGVVKAVGAVVSGVINFVASPFLGLFGTPDVPNPGTGDSSNAGVQIQREGTEKAIPVVYGMRRMAGHVSFAETGGDGNKYLWVAYAFCEGLVEGLYEVWINDIQLPAIVVKNLNAGQKTIVPGVAKDYGGNLTQLQFWTGGYFDNPDSTMVGSVIGYNSDAIFAGAPSWSPKMAYNGVSAMFARYEMPASGDNPFGGGIPELKVVMMGKKIERMWNGSGNDPITGDLITWDGIDPVYNYNSSPVNPIGYSYNPVDCLLDYLRNPRYGKGLSNYEIDWDSWAIASTKVATIVKYLNGGTTTGPILTFNYIVNTESTIFSNVQDMLKQFRGYMPYVNGRYQLFIEDGGNETDITSSSYPIAGVFTKDNIVGSITYTGIDRSSKYNVVTVKYVDPDQKWTDQIVVYPDNEADRLTYKQRDGGRENKGEFTFNGITSRPIAFDFARMIFNKSREQDTLSFAVTARGMELEVGDIVYVSANILKFGTIANQPGTIPWRIVSTKFNNDYTITLGLVRHVVGFYPYIRMGGYVYQGAVWVPKGASKIYPKEPKDADYYLGQIPPNNANRFGTTPIPWRSGGLYYYSGNAVSPNDVPTNPASQDPLTDVISIFKASFIPISANSAYCEVYFRQPTNAMYAQTSFYYKRDIASETNYTQVDNVTRLGANNIIVQRLGPLIVGQTYIIKAIVRYTTGDISTGVDIVRVTPTATATELDPTDSSEAAYNGWTLPTAIPANNKSATVRSATAYPILTGSTVTQPRGLTFSVLQDIDTYGQNNYVNGLQIFYKLSGATYWRLVNWSFGGAYTAGVSSPTFNLTDFGSRVNPGTTGNESLYDIVLRYTYNDNAPSLYQARFLQVPVEKTGSNQIYDALALATTTIKSELVTAYNLVLESAAPAGATTNSLNIIVGVRAIYARPAADGVNTFRMFIQQPNIADFANWYGITVYYRKKQIGVLTPYTKLEFLPIPKSTSGEYSVVIPNIDYISDYEMIINCKVSAGGTQQDATYALLGTFRSSNPGSPDIIAVGSGSFVKVFLSDALKTLTVIPNDPEPVASILEWKRVYPLYQDSTKRMGFYYYYQLKILLPASNYNSVYIMRRERTVATTTLPPYYGIGQWEYIRATKNDAQNDSFAPGMNLRIVGDVLIINMRGPQGIRKFNPTYTTTNGQALLDSRFTAFNPPECGEQNHEFLVWLEKTDATPSQYLLKLPAINYIQGTNIIAGDPNAATKELANTYENYQTGYTRNLSQADIWRDSFSSNSAVPGVATFSQFSYQYLPGGTFKKCDGPTVGSKVL